MQPLQRFPKGHSHPLGFSSLINIVLLPTGRVTNKTKLKEPRQPASVVKGKCALGSFLSILVIECQHKCLNVNLCSWMNKVQIKSKGMFLSLSTLVLCTNILV
jgi:hypothetical protein